MKEQNSRSLGEWKPTPTLVYVLSMLSSSFTTSCFVSEILIYDKRMCAFQIHDRKF